jgi:hypothetical protein
MVFRKSFGICAAFSVMLAVRMCFAQPVLALIGKVSNSLGIGLAGVSVRLANAQKETMTNAKGDFSFATSGVADKARTGSQTVVAVRGNKIRLVVEDPSEIAIDLFDLNGRSRALVTKRNIAAGSHCFPITSAMQPGIRIMRVRINGSETMYPLFDFAQNSNRIAGPVAVSGLNPLARLCVAADTLVAGKLHYAEQRIAVQSYSGTQNVTLVFAPPATARAVYSESVPTSIGATAAYTWDNSGTPPTSFTINYTTDRFEGTRACRVQGGYSGWSGWGMATTLAAGSDLSAFTGGWLHFAVKGTMTNVGAWVIWKNDNKTALSVDIVSYGYVPGDSMWHEVAIPLSVFGPIDIAHIDYFIALESPFNYGVYVANTWYIVDNIYFAKE